MCIEPPCARASEGLIHTPSHIKHRNPLKSNKHFDTLCCKKGGSDNTDNAPTKELLGGRDAREETNTMKLPFHRVHKPIITSIMLLAYFKIV